MVAYESLLTDALKLTKTFDVYPLAPFTNIPFRGSNGDLNATKDHQLIVEWFEKEPLSSLGLRLKNTNVLVLDVDDHLNDGAGIKELAALSNGNSLEGATIVKTPNGQGFHAYYHFPSNLTIEDVNLTNNIEILRTKVTAPGSRKRLKDGSIGEYVLAAESSLNDLKMMPKWLLDLIMSKQQGEQPNTTYQLDYNNTAGRTKKYTATLIEELTRGVQTSERNIWVTKYTGKLLALGTEPDIAYQFIMMVNESFVRPPLPDREVNSIFRSVLKREVRKRGGEISE
ncbi:bifunctional DNA primase/polymerase [Carnobacterium mobile]|uniref:bifunctional DNA primase/polymerase n=1 Tax=Carnobacterium mobile TaxID=2750 RepID=UPI0005553F9D|nr:bifunctional DNA primase/polymerase [Carnobacterium mobile]